MIPEVINEYWVQTDRGRIIIAAKSREEAEELASKDGYTVYPCVCPNVPCPVHSNPYMFRTKP